MARYLVIVESPGKIKKLKHILGADYQIVASMGHVMDLPQRDFGIDEAHSAIAETYSRVLDALVVQRQHTGLLGLTAPGRRAEADERPPV